jgi:N-acetylglucosamine-6-phosphate deacetylase
MADASPGGTVAVTGGRVLGPSGLAPADVVVEHGRIARIGPAARRPIGVPTLDATGAVVAPGYVDLQCNGGFGHDLTSDPGAIGAVAAALPAHGVTAFLPTIVSSPAVAVERALSALRDLAADHAGAVPLGLHVEGPMLSSDHAGTHALAHLRSPSLDLVAGWSRAAGVRLVTMAPELPGALDVVRALVAADVVVAAGHSGADTATAERAVDAGVTMATHLFNAMGGLRHRDPGLVGVALTDDRVVVGLIVDGLHVHPRAVALAWAAKGPGRVALVTDATAALDVPWGPRRLGDVDIVLGADGVRDAAGRLAGSALRMDDAVRNLRAATGCSLAEAVGAASAVPAAVLGERARGTVAAGARGDLVVLDDDLHVVATVVAGRVVYDARVPGPLGAGSLGAP